MIAHALTGLRLLLAVPAGFGFARPELMAPAVLAGLVLAAIASDILDGRVARRTGTETAAGQLFDHGADCTFVTACLAGAAWAGEVTALLPVLIVAAFGQYLLDSRLLYREKQLRMSAIGRWNGILYFAPPVVLAAGRLELPGGLGSMLTTAAGWLAWLLVISTVVSMADRAVAPWRQAR